jgi:hypothetical protein
MVGQDPPRRKNMASYTVDLTPVVVTPVSEGSLDTSVVEGLSTQRTFNDTLVVNGGDMKMVGRLADGATYDNTTFEMVSYDLPIGNPYFDAGMPVIEDDNATTGHPTANSGSGSTV